MKHTRFARALSAALALTLLAGCAAQAGPVPAPDVSLPPLPPAEAGWDVVYGDFSAELLRRCRTEGENVLISPLSVLLALGMTANGAKGDTLSAFEETFGMSLDQLNALCAELLAEYGDPGGSTESNLANGIWVADHVALEDAFAARCLDTFDAGLFAADFADPAAVKQVNAWVDEQTRGLIPGIIDRFDPTTALTLVNAVYLKNRWQSEFPTPTGEWELPFTSASGKSTNVPCMYNGIRNEQYLRTDGARGVVLPYDDGRLGFFALLPDEGVALDTVLSALSGQCLADLLNAAGTRRVDLCMPKFEVEWSASLADALSAMGLGVTFDPVSADFTNMGTSPNGPLYIGDVLHKTALKVNEKGTEAAAVTAVVMEACSEPMTDDVIRLTLDRPFLYGIVDLERGTPLFLGTYEQP